MRFISNIIAVLRGQFLIFPKINIGLIRVYGKVRIRGPKKNLNIGKRVIFWGYNVIILDDNNNDNIEIGNYVIIENHCYLHAHEGSIIIGDNSFLGVGVIIQGKGGVVIEENVMLAPGVKIFRSDHPTTIDTIPRKLQNEIPRPILIKSNVWIGASSIILKNVTIPCGSVIAAGSIIKGVLKESGLYGNPLRISKLIRKL